MVFSPFQVLLLAIVCSCLAAVVTHYFSFYIGGASSYSASLLLAVSQKSERGEELRRASSSQSLTKLEEDDGSNQDNKVNERKIQHSSVELRDESTGGDTVQPQKALKGRNPVFNDDVKQKRPIAEPEAKRWPDVDITKLDPSLVVTRNGNTHPFVAWLMSFPNRYAPDVAEDLGVTDTARYISHRLGLSALQWNLIHHPHDPRG